MCTRVYDDHGWQSPRSFRPHKQLMVLGSGGGEDTRQRNNFSY